MIDWRDFRAVQCGPIPATPEEVWAELDIDPAAIKSEQDFVVQLFRGVDRDDALRAVVGSCIELGIRLERRRSAR